MMRKVIPTYFLTSSKLWCYNEIFPDKEIQTMGFSGNILFWGAIEAEFVKKIPELKSGKRLFYWEIEKMRKNANYVELNLSLF